MTDMMNTTEDTSSSQLQTGHVYDNSSTPIGKSSPAHDTHTQRSRVSFDDEQNTLIDSKDVDLSAELQNYEDVLTLQVPNRGTVWLTSAKKDRRLLCNCFPSKRKRQFVSDRLDDNKMSKISHASNGNHFNTDSKKEASSCDSRVYDDAPDTNTNPSDPGSSDTEGSMVWTTNFLAALSILIIVFTFPFSLIYCIRIVTEYERAVVLRMGNLIPKGRGVKGPGLFFILPCIDSVRKVDLRTVTFAIPPQELLTRDSVTVSVDAVVYYRVLNPVASVLNIEDAARSTRLLAQTTIRNVLGTKDLAQILMDRDEISGTMQASLDAITDAWGVKVERVEIKDVRLPLQLQRAMAAEAEAAREARAKVIAAKGEQDAARSLKKAARVISTSPMAFQLRYLQTLSAISTEKNSTIFFPVPIDILRDLGSFSSPWSLLDACYKPVALTSSDDNEEDAHSDTV